MADITIDRISPEAIDRFWSRVAKAGPDDCWEWQAYRDKDGYGRIKFRNHPLPRVHCCANRTALILTGSPPPFAEAQALHSCHNPPCCNPAHLRWGTLRENVDDMLAAGRSIRGAAHPRAKLNDDMVRAIRKDRRGARTIAREYAVSKPVIDRIRNGDGWKHVAD